MPLHRSFLFFVFFFVYLGSPQIMVHPAHLSSSSPFARSVPELQYIPFSSINVDNIPSIMTHYNDLHNGTLGKQKVLVKSWRLMSASEDNKKKFAQRLCLELVKWKQASSHPHILPIIGISNDNVSLAPSLVVPFFRSGNVNEYISRNPGANVLELVSKHKPSAIIDVTQTQTSAQQLCGVATGIHHLHSLDPPIVHGKIRGVRASRSTASLIH
jgi:serine/threonine protein kinase